MKREQYRPKRNSLPRVQLSLLLIITLFFLSCTSGEKDEKHADSNELIVAAAANLTDAFDELGKLFTDRTKIRVTFSFGATGDLTKQIENGAPFDLFASADTEHIDALKQKGLIAKESSYVFAKGRLVLWMPESERVRIKDIEEIKLAGVEKIAVANPEIAPYGRATVEALRALDLWSHVEEKVVYAQSVAQAKQFAATGNADVAFIPRALVKETEGRAIEIEEELHRPINQAIGLISASKRQEAARRFIEFVLSAEGQSLLKRYGYGTVDEK